MIGFKNPRAAGRASTLGRLAAVTAAAVLVTLLQRGGGATGVGIAQHRRWVRVHLRHWNDAIGPHRRRGQAQSEPLPRRARRGGRRPARLSGGTPPLIYHGGPMMTTTASADKLVVTPIFWAPSGFTFASAYKTLLGRYLSDAVADSDKSSNVFSTLFEYNGSNGFINYRFKKNAAIIDTNAYPSAGCTTNSGAVYWDNSGYTTCLDDDQIQAEINAQAASHGLPRNLGNIYVMFLPKHVESCFYAGNPTNPKQQCTINPSPSAAYCAYHGESGGNTVYANMPFPVYSSPVGPPLAVRATPRPTSRPTATPMPTWRSARSATRSLRRSPTPT